MVNFTSIVETNKNKRKIMINISRLMKRISYITAATVVSLSSLLALMPQNTFAAQTQATFRQVKMSSAKVGTTTRYEVSFKVSQTYAIAGLKGIVVEFCSDTPLVDSTTCTNTNSFSTSAVSLVSTAGTMDASGWSAAAIDTNKGVALSKAGGNSGTIAINDVQTITLDGIVNPNAIGTFYARIYTYASTAAATGFLAASGPGAYLDYGGAAMSIANEITVTAKVQETLTFCAMVSGTCGSPTGSSVALGVSGVLISTIAGYTGTSTLGLAHNAVNGVTVRAKAAVPATGAGPTITSTGNTCTADSTTSTVEQFGFRISAFGSGMTNGGAVYGTGTCTGAGFHAFNSANLATTATAYGEAIITSASPQDETESTIEYFAKGATTTEAGIYTSTFTYIATGSY
jgi:hypothetical protein